MKEMRPASCTISPSSTVQYQSCSALGLLVCRTMCEMRIGDAMSPLPRAMTAGWQAVPSAVQPAEFRLTDLRCHLILGREDGQRPAVAVRPGEDMMTAAVARLDLEPVVRQAAAHERPGLSPQVAVGHDGLGRFLFLGRQDDEN